MPGGLGVVDGWIVADGVAPIAAGRRPVWPASSGRIMPIDELAIPGPHNVSNALAAIAVALLFGVDARRDPRAAARRSPGVEHRLETVATIDGVRFVNDSQGTQPDAVIAALRAFDRADRADRRRPRQGHRPRRARPRRRRAGAAPRS